MGLEEIRQLALVMTNVCVRNTVIEDYHANGQLSDEEMKAFNQEVANKVYTFMRLAIFNLDHQEAADFMKMVMLQFPHGWDQPQDDPALAGSLSKYRKQGLR